MDASKTRFPPVRACIFDMDGLLLNSEDIITSSVNQLLAEHGRPEVPTSIRAQMMGIPKSTDGDTFHDWAKLPISREQFALELKTRLRQNFPSCQPLPGAERILSTLSQAHSACTGERINLALASTTTTQTFELKASRDPSMHLLNHIPSDRRVLGDDSRLGNGSSKPAPDIYLLALETLNAGVDTNGDKKRIAPDECLVFEDSIIGVEAGRRAGMRVIWVPHPDLAAAYEGKEKEILAGRAGIIDIGNEWQLGNVDDGWAESVPSLECFDYEKYGISVLI